jgi:hypothetical protein
MAPMQPLPASWERQSMDTERTFALNHLAPFRSPTCSCPG